MNALCNFVELLHEDFLAFFSVLLVDTLWLSCSLPDPGEERGGGNVSLT